MSGRSRRKKLVRSKRLKESDSDTTTTVKAGAANVASASDLQPSSGDDDYDDAEFQPLVNSSELANQLILERDQSFLQGTITNIRTSKNAMPKYTSLHLITFSTFMLTFFI